jgi:hypothetical protein
MLRGANGNHADDYRQGAGYAAQGAAAALGVAPGDKVAVEILPGGRAELRAAKPEGSIQKFIGSLQRPGRDPLSIDEISKAAAQGWVGRR